MSNSKSYTALVLINKLTSRTCNRKLHSFCTSTKHTSNANRRILLQGVWQRHTAASLKTVARSVSNIVHSTLSLIEIPNNTFDQIVWQDMHLWADNIAIECGVTGRSYSYAKLRQLCRRLAASLLKMGLVPGQVVALILPNIPEFPVAILGAVEAGLIVSTINPVYTTDEICYQLENSAASCVITFPSKLDTLLEVKEKLKSFQVELLHIICIDSPSESNKDLPGGVLSFSQMVGDDIDVSALTPCNPLLDDTTFLPYSSGTTGIPKGVCLTHRNMISNMLHFSHPTLSFLDKTTGDHQDVTAMVLPFFHIYGISILMHMMNKGCKLISLPKFEAESFLNALQESTILYAVPPMLLFLGAHSAVVKKHFAKLKVVYCGAAPIGARDIEKCIQRAGTDFPIFQAYGLTETSPVVLLPPRGFKGPLSSVGCLVPNTSAKVVSLDTGEPVGPGIKGELCVSGPQIMKGYLNNQAATDSVIKEGWFYTGDIAYYDEHNNFYIVDRIKELIKVKGFQVAPAELEELLRSHEHVADAAVIGVEDKRSGEAPVAFVVLKQTGKGISPKVIQDFVSSKVAEFKQLKDVFIVDSIPKSASGKILRKELKKDFEKTK